MRDAQFTEAHTVLGEELSIPYIPRKYEEPLIAYYNQCRSRCKWKDIVIREKDIETLLKGPLEKAFLVTEQLKKDNIHNHMDVMADYLSQNPRYLVCSLVIEAMTERDITDKVSMDIDGPEVTLSPCSLDAPTGGEGALEAVSRLKDWFENDNLAFTTMCVETLVKEVYLRLFFNTEEDEALPLTAVITVCVFHAYKEHGAWILFKKGRNLARYRSYELLLKEREI